MRQRMRNTRDNRKKPGGRWMDSSISSDPFQKTYQSYKVSNIPNPEGELFVIEREIHKTKLTKTTPEPTPIQKTVKKNKRTKRVAKQLSGKGDLLQ